MLSTLSALLAITPPAVVKEASEANAAATAASSAATGSSAQGSTTLSDATGQRAMMRTPAMSNTAHIGACRPGTAETMSSSIVNSAGNAEEKGEQWNVMPLHSTSVGDTPSPCSK